MSPDNLRDLLSQPSEGILQLGGARMALLDIQAGFWGIRRQIEVLIGTRLTSSVLQQAGANGGASFAQSFAATLEQSGDAAFSTCLQVYQTAGFGQFEITSLEWPIGRIEIRADQTFEAWMMRQNDHSSPDPCCAYTAGVLVGFVNVISGRKDVVCIEHTCQGKGDEYCQFELLLVEEARDQTVVAFSPDPGLGRQLNLLEMLFERMPMGIAVLDREYRIQRYNPTWYDFSTRYAPPAGAPVAPGVGYFAHLPGTELVVLPLFKRVLAGELVQQDGVRLESGGIVTFWDVVLAPLVENNQVVGILNVAVDATERVALQQNLEKRVEDRTREIERQRQVSESLRDLMAALNSERSSQEVFDYITTQSASLLRADACLMYSVKGELLTNESNFNLPEAFTALKSGEIYLGEANRRLLEGNPVKISDARTYLDNLLDKPELTEFQRRWYRPIRENYASYIGFPLIVRNQLFGGLVFYYRSERDFNDEDIQVGLMVGEQAALAIENARLYQAESDRREVAESLRETLAVLNSKQPLGEILEHISKQAVQLLGAYSAVVYHIKPQTQELVIQAGYRVPAPLKALGSIPLYEGGAIESMFNQETYVIRNIQTRLGKLDLEPYSEQKKFNQWLQIINQNFSAYLGMPLVIDGEIYGGLGLYYLESQDFSKEEIELGITLANQAVLAIENARLLERAEEAAIASERNRLARDLHDAVTQTLFSSTMIAEVLPKIWERDPEEGQRRLEELRQLTRGALSEMRTLLVELRPAALVDTDLGDLIGHQVNAFIARTRLSVEFDRNCKENPPTEIKEMFYRIAQEALNNIAKHADASAVKVKLDCKQGSAELIIRDDGLGFDLEAAMTDGLGLGIMGERASSVGAQFEIFSRIHEGTHLRIFWQNPNNEEHKND